MKRRENHDFSNYTYDQNQKSQNPFKVSSIKILIASIMKQIQKKRS